MRKTIISNIIIISILILLVVFTNVSYVTTYSSTNNIVVYHGNKESNNASLMVNVYWGNEYISQMLKIFKDNNIITTFFIGGTWANKYPDLLQEIANHGHEIANHGFFHKDGKTLNYKDNYDEINTTHELIKSIINVEMNLFAPPSGSFGDNTISACKNLGYTPIMWTYDTIDWRDQDCTLILKRTTKKIEGGNLILMHPTKATVGALQNIIDAYNNAGINITTVSNTIK